MKTRVCVIYLVHDCLWKQYSVSNLLQVSSKFIFWTILVTIRLFTQFQLKVRASKLWKSAKSCLTWKLLHRSFHWGPNSVSKDFQVSSRTVFKTIKQIPAKIRLFLNIRPASKNKMKKKFLQTIVEIIFWHFLILYQFFFSPQVKRSVIISNKHDIYKLPHEFSNNWWLRILGN